MNSSYAVFDNVASAHHAQRWLQAKLGTSAVVRTADSPEWFSHHVVPLAMTQSRTGAWGGGLAVALVSAVALGVALVTANLLSPTTVLAPFTTVAVCGGLAAILGSLAGALAFASNSKGLMQRLRAHVDSQQPVVIVLGARQLPVELSRFRPISVGVMN